MNSGCCHRCGYAAEIAAGKWAEVPWLETPCSACELRQSSVGTVAYDEGRSDDGWEDDDDAGGAVAVGGDAESVSWERDDPMMPVSVLASMARGLMMLPAEARNTVCLRLQGLKYREIAEREGVSVAAVELRHRRAMRHWPALKALFAVKVAKQKRRKKVKVRER